MRAANSLRIGGLVGALLLAAPAGAEDLPPIREVVSFGDSLTDAGTFFFRFTTNPGLTWAQHLALDFGQMPFPNQSIAYGDVYKGNAGNAAPGGLNYAEGGARANAPYSAVSDDREGKPISTAVQLEHFLAQHRKFEADQLVTLFIGTNDVAFNFDAGNDPDLAARLRADQPASSETMAKERSRVEKAADDAARTASAILDHGARRLVVLKLIDLADMPWFRTAAAQAHVRELGRLFNARLENRLPKDPRILIVETQDFIEGLKQGMPGNGFRHGANEDACRELDKDFCFANGLREPDADQTYIFAASEHLTTRTNRLLADYVLDRIRNSALK